LNSLHLHVKELFFSLFNTNLNQFYSLFASFVLVRIFIFISMTTIAMMSYVITDSIYERIIYELFNTEQFDYKDNVIYILMILSKKQYIG